MESERPVAVVTGASGGIGRWIALGLAREGLLELGYNAIEAERLLADAQGDTAEDLIAQALRAAARPA